MAIAHLQFVDWLIIVIYFIFVLGIGFYLRKQIKTGNDFFMAGRRNSAWLAGLAFLSANMGALELLGMSGQAYKYGMLTAHFYWIGAIPAMLFLGIFMMPFYYSSKIHSVPGYLKLRFNESTRTLNALGFAIMTLLVAGINLYAMALVLHLFVGWNFNVCIWLSSLTIAIYIFLGGLSSAIYSEVLQFFLIWFGLLLAVILGIIDMGGWSGVTAHVANSYLHLWSNTATSQSNPMLINWLGIVMGLGFVLSFGYWTTDFLVVQRAFSAKDMRSAQMTPVLASFFKMALPLMVVGAGLIILALQNVHRIEPLTTPDNALLVLLYHYYPAGLLGLGVTALLAGFMSGQAGNVSAFNTVFTYDLYRAHLVKNASDRHYVWIGRIATLAGILISVMTAYWTMSMPSIMEYMQALFSIVNAPLFATILLGMFWARTNGHGAFWGLLVGMVVSASMFLLVKFNYLPVQYVAFNKHASPMAANLWRAVWAWSLTFGLTIIISLLTKAPDESKIKGLVHKSIHVDKHKHLPWYRRPAIWAVIAFIVFIALNIIFW
jgi:solute:Na+ symporter, SSS family